MFSNQSKKYKCLLSIEPYCFSGKQIGMLRDMANGRSYENRNYLPEYCIKNDGTIGLSREFHQYTGELNNPSEKYILFDIATLNNLLKLELDEFGFNEPHGLFSDIVDWEKTIINTIDQKFHHYTFNDYKRTVICPQYIVVELEYYRCSYEYDEWDVRVDLKGFLNKNLELISYENKRIGVNEV